MMTVGKLAWRALAGANRARKYGTPVCASAPQVDVVGGVIRIGATDGSKGIFPSHEEVCVLPSVVWIQSRADAGLMARMAFDGSGLIPTYGAINTLPIDAPTQRVATSFRGAVETELGAESKTTSPGSEYMDSACTHGEVRNLQRHKAPGI